MKGSIVKQQQQNPQVLKDVVEISGLYIYNVTRTFIKQKQIITRAAQNLQWLIQLENCFVFLHLMVNVVFIYKNL